MNSDGTYRYFSDSRQGEAIHSQKQLQEMAEAHTRELRELGLKRQIKGL